MSNKKPGMTPDEITQASALLRRLQDSIVKESVAIGNCWAKSEVSRFMTAMQSAADKLGDAMRFLESISARQIGDTNAQWSMTKGTMLARERRNTIRLSVADSEGAQSEAITDNVPTDHVVYEIDINGKTYGVWITPLEPAKPALPSDLNKDDMHEWWTMGTVRGVPIANKRNGDPF